MYEVGMSANSRVEPVFKPQITQWEGEAPVSLGAEHLFYEEEADGNFTSLLIKSGFVVLLTISVYAGYQFFTSTNTVLSSETQSEQDGSGKQINLADKGQTNSVRKIDLTQTGSVKKDVNPIGKPVPITSTDSTKATFHVVQSGDTLSQIGRKFNISTAEIMKINSIEDARRIKPGMKLIISK